MIPYKKKEHYTIDDLAEIVSLLRSEEGCPWDKVQTHTSLRSDLIEETYEVIEAIDQDDPEMLREELGDLLLQVVFHAGRDSPPRSVSAMDRITRCTGKLLWFELDAMADPQPKVSKVALVTMPSSIFR